MKRFYIFAICLVFAIMAAAQEDTRRPQRTPEQMAEKQTEMMQRDLSLTQTQRDTVSSILLKYARMYKANEDRDVRMIRMEFMQKELQQVLSEEQFSLYMEKVRDRGPKKQSAQRMIQKEAEAPAVIMEYDSTKTD